MVNATAKANPNIAFIKYWGDRDERLHIPANSSLSMNLEGLYTQTRVAFDQELGADVLTINDRQASDGALQRASSLLDRVRQQAGLDCFASVESHNNFPSGAGIASSASAFAALALAASKAAGLDMSERDLSRLARTGSGSACRSIPPGFVQWQAGDGDQDSYAFSIAPPDHWDLIDCITIISEAHKPVGSTEGHLLASSSALQEARLAGVPFRLEECLRAIEERDFEALARVSELDSNLMHAVMFTSNPPLLYWQGPTLEVMHTVIELRTQGSPVFYTVDAGPNVHVLTTSAYLNQVRQTLEAIPGVIRVLTARAGGGALLLDSLPG
jgi:diphosphomevalonate decarboxylase